MRELIPGEDDQSVHEIFDPVTKTGNGGDQETLLGALCQRRSTSAEWRRAWQRRKLEDANHLTLCLTCVLEASVTSDTAKVNLFNLTI